MPSLKKGAYCFATIGRSLDRYVDQVLFAQYLLTPSLLHLIITKLDAGVALNK